MDFGFWCFLSHDPFAKDLICIRPLRKSVTVANGVKVFSTGVGTAKTSIQIQGKEHKLNLRETLLVPRLPERLHGDLVFECEKSEIRSIFAR